MQEKFTGFGASAAGIFGDNSQVSDREQCDTYSHSHLFNQKCMFGYNNFSTFGILVLSDGFLS